MNTDLERILKVAWKHLGNPVLGIGGVVLFLALVVSAKVRADLWLQLEHLIGVMLVVIGAALVLLFACYFLFDAFLSFREFAQAIRAWENGRVPTLPDAIYVLAMGARSGLIFLGLCILASGALRYLDFGGG